MCGNNDVVSVLPFLVDGTVERQTVVIMHKANVGKFDHKRCSLVPKHKYVATSNVAMDCTVLTLMQ